MASAIEQWMSGYITAWDSNRPEDVRALFADDAEYRFFPWGEPVRGVEQILTSWLESADRPDDHTFSWHPVGRDGGRHFVQGHTAYADGRTYENLWIVDLDENGRAAAFTEWYMKASEPLGPNG